MHDVSWDLYTRVLEQIGDGATRVTFSDGSIEVMSPLPEHEPANESIGVLIDVLAADRRMTIARFGSTTFRREDRQQGLEPDKCYYFGKSVARVRGMKRFDPEPGVSIFADGSIRSVRSSYDVRGSNDGATRISGLGWNAAAVNKSTASPALSTSPASESPAQPAASTGVRS